MRWRSGSEESRSALRVAGLLLCSWMTGCAAVDHPSHGVGAPGVASGLAEAPVVSTAPEKPESPPGAAKPLPPPDAHVAGPSKAPPRKPSEAPSTPPGARPAPKASGTPAVAVAPASPVAAAPASPAPAVSPSRQPAAPPLDLKALVERLRETRAIGMFTKLALKNQVDDLLELFREHYAAQVNTPPVELRPPYDRLLLKVLAAVQDEDPDLARAIVDSREPIWNILADPVRFATILT